MRSAPRGSIPWTQALAVYLQGLMVTGRIAELLAALERAPRGRACPRGQRRGWRSPSSPGSASSTTLGQISDATAARGPVLRRSSARPADREPLARFWWNALFGLRASYAHEDPWAGLVHSEAIQAIFDAIGDERTFLILQRVSRHQPLVPRGARAAERALEGVAAADGSLGHRRLAAAAGPGLAARRPRRARRGARPRDPARASTAARTTSRWRRAAAAGRSPRCSVAWATTTRPSARSTAALAMAIPLESSRRPRTLAALRLAQGRAATRAAAAEDAVACAGHGRVRHVPRRVRAPRPRRGAPRHRRASTPRALAIAEARARLLAIAGRIPDPAYKQSFLEARPRERQDLRAGAPGSARRSVAADHDPTAAK